MHVSLAPAQISLGEIGKCRRVGLEALRLDRQHPNFVTTATHIGGFQLVMAQHMPAKRRCARQDGQMAVGSERSRADQGVMAPIWSAIGIPPRRAHGECAHAMAHAELEHPRKPAGRRHADHKRLQDTDLGPRLHRCDKPDDRITGHDAV
ncbi:hypothetical protein D3C80_505490 [compost metagenome]